MGLIEQRITAIVAEVAELDPAAIEPAGALADLGVDSLMSVEIAVDVERAFGLHFDESELKQLWSFGSLVELTRAKLAAVEQA